MNLKPKTESELQDALHAMKRDAQMEEARLLAAMRATPEAIRRATAKDAIRRLQTTTHAFESGLDRPNFCDTCGTGWASNVGATCGGDIATGTRHNGIVRPLSWWIIDVPEETAPLES